MGTDIISEIGNFPTIEALFTALAAVAADAKRLDGAQGHGLQLSGSMDTGEHGGVATIGLHPIARLHRDQ